MVISVVQNNVRAQTILPLSTNMCDLYDTFTTNNWPAVAAQSANLINAGTFSVDNFPYLWYFQAVADYNMENQMSAVMNLNYILSSQGLANIAPQDFMDGVAALDPLITDGIMMGLQPIGGFTYYQGIYSICSDTVDIPSDTSNQTYLEDAFILKNYQEDVGSINSVPAGTYVGTVGINTNDSAGEILQKFAMQSSDINPIEIVAPSNMKVYEDDAGTVPFEGIINSPTILSNSVANELSDVITVIERDNDQNTPMYFKDATNGTDINVTMKIPTTSENVGENVLIYYSNDDGVTWNFHDGATLSSIGGETYAVTTSKHATIFAIIGGGTGNFVINNDDATTTSPNVTLNIYAPTAQNMRFQNDGTGGARSTWESYATGKAWTLSAGAGTKTVYAQFDTDGNTSTIEAETSNDINYTVPVCGAGGPNEGCISLEITSVTGSCVYGTSVYMGTTAFSTTNTGTLTTGFQNSIGGDSWYCEDSEGDTSWTLDMASADLENGAINTIDSGNVYLKLGSNVTIYGGTCSTGSDLNTSTYVAINGTTTVFEKTAAQYETCSIGIDSLSIKVDVPPYQSIGSYTGVLTITIPGFDGISN